MKYIFRNRYVFPDKAVLVVEDDLAQQWRMSRHFLDVFGHQSNVRFIFVPTALEAIVILESKVISDDIYAIILDHDLQIGDGVTVLEALNDNHKLIPVITASGQPLNNERLMDHGATHCFTKDEIVNGMADEVLKIAIGDISIAPQDWKVYL